MKKLIPSLILCLAAVLSAASCNSSRSEMQPGSWISVPGAQDGENQWIAFRKDISLEKVPAEVVARIAVDSKYWLWINDEMVVFEGGVKRGPNPDDTYCDEVDLAPYLQPGENKLALLLYYFGKDGFSHHSTGIPSLFFESEVASSDSTWMCRRMDAYQTCDGLQPNWRLPESNIKFVAANDIPGWQTAPAEGFVAAEIIGKEGDGPWNKLVSRDIPQWKDFGVKEAEMQVRGDTVIGILPYNMQLTPVITVNDPVGGNTVMIQTDHIMGGGEATVRAEYVTKAGDQTYESYGWMSGQQIHLIVPEGVEVRKICYRETGYASEPVEFNSDNDFWNRFWKKGLNTLYVNMRDTYFDCPDRERALWWGDASILTGESFYMFDRDIDDLTVKCINQLCAFQRADSVLYSPEPGIWTTELPSQSLAAVGKYGFWNCYFNTGRREIVEKTYPSVKKYLDIWQFDENGLPQYRQGGWDWGDWGFEIDCHLIEVSFYYLALEGARNMAELLGLPEDAASYTERMEKACNGFRGCWTGTEYRAPGYEGDTDDRVQAMAVVCGFAEPDKYSAISAILHDKSYASSYMEKYVMDALFKMGEPEYAVERVQQKYGPMVYHPDHTTLFEGWLVGSGIYGGGSTNHAWSGGPLISMCQLILGVNPTSAGWKTFSVAPNPVSIKEVDLVIPSAAGDIAYSYSDTDSEFTLRLSVPAGAEAFVTMPYSGEERTLKSGEHTLVADK